MEEINVNYEISEVIFHDFTINNGVGIINSATGAFSPTNKERFFVATLRPGEVKKFFPEKPGDCYYPSYGGALVLADGQFFLVQPGLRWLTVTHLASGKSRSFGRGGLAYSALSEIGWPQDVAIQPYDAQCSAPRGDYSVSRPECIHKEAVWVFKPL